MVLSCDPDAWHIAVEHIQNVAGQIGDGFHFVADATAARADITVVGGLAEAAAVYERLDDNLSGLAARVEFHAFGALFPPSRAARESSRLAVSLKEQFDPDGILPTGEFPYLGI
jgi:hypothetical protein